MTDTISGFPFWLLQFAKDASAVNPAAIDTMVREIKEQGITDLFLFSHGWNNDQTDAVSLYTRYFAQVRALIDDGTIAKARTAKIGIAGVVWPSILWPDDAPTSGVQPVVPDPRGGGASMGGGPSAPPRVVSPAEIQAAIAPHYDANQQAILAELIAMLTAREGTQAAADAFKAKLGEFLATERATPADPRQPDDAEGAMTTLSDTKWKDLLSQLADQAERRGTAAAGGSVGLGDVFKKMWNGAKDALRIATYWQMKNRAGVIGKQGLAPLLARIAAESPATRVHLMGHSFGARLVSFSLSGLPSSLTGPASPVKSLFLLQGAFSHYAFADKLPADATRSGALKSMSQRVDGPLMTTHTLRDYAVGVTYPAASMVNGDDSSAFDAMSDRWGAMGHDGAKGMSAASTPLAAPGARYTLAKGKWLNLDGNSVIIHGSPPIGAHGDIVHPHTAWASLAAAGIV